jgi:hypothetical protein
MSKFILRITLTTAFLGTAALAIAQTAVQPAGSVASPVLGFILDTSGALRPMIGIPGSASVGQAMDLGLTMTQVAVPPGHDYILANTNSGLVLLRTQGKSVTQQAISAWPVQTTTNLATCYALAGGIGPGRKLTTCVQGPSSSAAMPAIDNIVLSRTGSAAAMLSRSEERIYSLGNLPDSPALIGTFDVADLGAISAFAISDDGKTLAVGASSGDSGSLFLVNTGQAAQPIGMMHHPSAISFLSNGSSAVVADDAENNIYMVSNGQLFAIASEIDGISKPIAIAVSNDNQRVFVGNSEPGSITTLSLSGGPAESIVCHCTPTGLYPTNTDSVFRLTEYSGRPVLLFDASAAEPRIVFVPAGLQF